MPTTPGQWPDTGTGETIPPRDLMDRAANLALVRLPPSTGGPTSVVNKNGNYTMNGTTDGIVNVDTTSGVVTITLPPAAAGGSGAVKGWRYTIKRTAGAVNALNIAPQGGATIDGVAGSQVLSSIDQGMTLYSDGSNWWVDGTINARHAPTAAFSATPVVPLQVNVDGSASSSPDSGTTITSYAWTWGDGNSSTTSTPTTSHSYAAAATYTVGLVVTDSNGRTSSQVTHSVSVTGNNPNVNRVPFNSGSPYNETLAQLYPGGIPVLGQTLSDTYMGRLGVSGTDAGVMYTASREPQYQFGSDTTQFCIAAYLITQAMVTATPATVVAFSAIYCEAADTNPPGTTYIATGGGTHTLPFQIPAAAQPTPPLYPSAGGDSQFTFWDRDNVLGNGTEFWDFWEIVTDGGVGGAWKPDGSGRLQCTNFSHYPNEQTTDGVPINAPKAYASRGPGMPYLCCGIFPWEIQAGVITHPIGFAFNHPSSTFTSPASKSDGSSTPAADMPEGGRFKLRDSFDINAMTDPNAKIVARALQVYGAMIVDNSGTLKVYHQADVAVGAGGSWAVGASSGANWGGIIAQDYLAEIPVDELLPIDPNNSVITPESQILLDTTGLGTNDPINTVPVLIEHQYGTTASPGSATATLTAVNTNELVLAFAFQKANHTSHVEVSGPGATGLSSWRRLTRFSEPRSLGSNLSLDVWICRASSGTLGSGVITATTSGGSNALSFWACRFTVNCTIRQKFINCQSNATPTTKIGGKQGCTTNCLIVQVVGVFNTHTLTADTANGATAVDVNKTTGQLSVNLLTRRIAGDVGGAHTAAPTLNSGDQWISFLGEIT